MSDFGKAVRTAAFLISIAATTPAAEIPSPSQFLGFEVGSDRVLADYRQIEAYFTMLAEASPRVELVRLGPTTLGQDMLMAVISSEANIADLPRIQADARKLADPRGLADVEVDELVAAGKVVLLITCNIHSTEIGASQMTMEWAHALATAADPETQRRLDSVVLLLVPSLNPDGQIMETEWYRKHLGTPYEGGRMPWLYHHYVGHDNNRDWYMLTQKETRALSRAVYREWFPQVWLDEHQMGPVGPRIFVPPYAEPLDPDIHPLVWREVNMIGAHMALRLEQAGKSGVIYGYSYDAYWPGGTKNTAWFKNITGLLTEVASVRMATPMFIAPTELAGGRKGLVDYEAQTNFPNPWPGGWWRLRDIMDYERIASDAILEACADRRADLLRNMAARARAAIGASAPGAAYRIPARQHDPAGADMLAQLMVEHGVEVWRDPSGDLWIPLAQPYGKFVAEMFSIQRYPEVKLVPGPEIVRPYDVAAWSLPLMMGVVVERAALPEGLHAYEPAAPAAIAPGVWAALEPGSPESAKAINAALRAGAVSIASSRVEGAGRSWPAGTVFFDPAGATAAAGKLAAGLSLQELSTPPAGLAKLTAPRVGVYKPWLASMDEGWTRFVLEQYGFEPKSLDNKTIQAGKLRSAFDVIVMPDLEPEVIAKGKPKREDEEMKYFVELPPDYQGGLDEAGAKALKEFVAAGGTLVALASSCDYLLEQFNLPVLNVLAKSKPEAFACPGSLLRGQVTPGHPLTHGLPAELPLFVDHPIAFQTVPPGSELERWVLISYPEDRRDVLMSGWIRGEELLTRRAAAVALRQGQGKLVLLGFRPQHRAQTHATYPLLFHSLYWAML